LNAVPERAKHDTSDAPRISRLAVSRKVHGEDYQPDVPPLKTGEYLIGYLFEVGPTMAAGGYPGPITNTELVSWCELTGIQLAPWESRMLRRLSHEYLSETHRAEKFGAQAPWRPDGAKPEVTATQASLRALSRG
jgi:hypothetical protein